VTTATARREMQVVVRGSSGLDAVARAAGVHPELVRRLASLGFIDPSTPDAAARIARAVRLRSDLGLNYAGALLACELLDRIEQLERRLRRYEPDHRQRR
jgi:chaperone modulatory protein CbpM